MTAQDNAVPNKQYKPYQIPPKDKPAAGVLVRQSESLECHTETRCHNDCEKQFKRN